MGKAAAKTSSESSAETGGFRGPVVCRAVGISYRQLDYWARTGLVTPSVQEADGSGSQRIYSFTDVVHLKVIKRLLEAGVSLPKIRKAVAFLREELRKPLGQVTLVSDGTGIYAATSADEVVDLLAGGQGVFGIAVGKVYEELQATVAELRVTEGARDEGSSAKVRGG